MNKQEDILNKSFQSCNINFLIGAGASIPAKRSKAKARFQRRN